MSDTGFQRSTRYDEASRQPLGAVLHSTDEPGKHSVNDSLSLDHSSIYIVLSRPIIIIPTIITEASSENHVDAQCYWIVQETLKR